MIARFGATKQRAHFPRDGRIRPLLFSTAAIAIMSAISASPATAQTVFGPLVGQNGIDGNGNMGGIGGLAGIGTGQGGTGGNGGTGGVFEPGTPGSNGTGGGGNGGGFSDSPGGSNGGGGAGGFSNINGQTGGGGGGGGGISLTFAYTSRIVIEAGASVSGGNGGGAGNVNGGSGGDGISLQGDYNSIVNAGSISAGDGAHGMGIAGNAISITGANNRLELVAGGTITGNVVAIGTGNVLALAGGGDGTFNIQQFYGFTTLQKEGANTWTITGNGSAFTGNAEVTSGRLILNGSLGGIKNITNSAIVEAAVANAFPGSVAFFNDTSVLEVTAANAVSGSSTLIFNDTSTLQASIANAVSGGTQNFLDNSTLNATTANAVSGGSRIFIDDSTLQASVANAVSGGTQTFFDNSTLNASAANALNGGTVALDEASTLNVLADNALAPATEIRFSALYGADGTLRLNGYSTGIGNFNSVDTGAGIITNGAAGDSVLTVHSGPDTPSAFDGSVQDGSGGGTLGLTLASGELLLAGVNSYTGGTTVNGGTMRAGSASAFVANTAYAVNGGTLALDGFSLTASSLAGTGGTVALGTADLTINQAASTTYAGELTGTGALMKTGAGTLTLSGNSLAFAGGTAVSAGTLRVDGVLGGDVLARTSGVLSGTGRIAGDADITGNGVLSGTSGQSLRVDGNLLMNSTSTVNVALGALPGAALFDIGGDLTLDGTLNVTDAGGFGPGVYRLFSYAGNLVDNGLEIGTAPAGISADALSVVANPGQVTLVSAAGAQLSFWDGGDAALHDNGVVNGGGGIWRADGRNWTQADGAFNGPLQPNPTFAIFQNAGSTVTVDTSAGAIAVTGMQFASDGYRIEGGAISLAGPGGETVFRIGDGTAAGAAITATIASELTGNSTLVKNDFGTLILTGANSYDGGTRINSGALQIGDGGTTGSTIGAVQNDGTLILNRSDAWAFDSVLSGSGLIRHAGPGLTTLTADSSAFAGTVHIENGTLSVNGSLGGTLQIMAGGRLLGSGRIGNLIVGGTLAPGNSIGTLDIAGNLSFSAGSVYQVETDAAGNADRINVAGTANLAGGSVQVLAGAGDYAPTTNYTILSATGGVSGTFSGGVTSNLAFLDPSLSYDANNAYLRLTRNDVGFDGIGTTPNQIAVGAGAESLGLANPVHDAILGLSADQARYALDQLSGEIHASARSLLIEDSRFVRSAVNDRLRAAFDRAGAGNAPVVTYGSGGPQASAATTDRPAVWGNGFGSWGRTDSDLNAARVNHNTGGLILGVDAPVFDSGRLGIVAGYSYSDFNVRDRRSTGSSDNYHLGLYGGAGWGDLALRAGAAYSWHEIATSRTVTYRGLDDIAKSDTNAGTAQVFGEIGYSLSAGNASFEPFAALAYVSLDTDGFTETGGPAALASQSATTDATFTTLGLRAATGFTLGGIAAAARGAAGWRHAFGDVTPLSALRFASGGDAFAIGGVPIAKDSAVIEAGLDLTVSPMGTLGLSYGGQFGSGVTDQVFRANFAVKF